MRLNQFSKTTAYDARRWFIQRLTWYLEEVAGIVPDSTASLVKGRHDHQRTANRHFASAATTVSFQESWILCLNLRDALLHREYWFSLGKLGVRHLPLSQNHCRNHGNTSNDLRSCSIVKLHFGGMTYEYSKHCSFAVKILPWNFSFLARADCDEAVSSLISQLRVMAVIESQLSIYMKTIGCVPSPKLIKKMTYSLWGAKRRVIAHWEGGSRSWRFPEPKVSCLTTWSNAPLGNITFDNSCDTCEL